MTINDLSLAKMLSNLKDEIKSAQINDGDDNNAIFELGDVTIKTRVAINSKGKSSGKVSFYVVTAEVGGEIHNENSHEITITLKPKASMFMGNRKR